MYLTNYGAILTKKQTLTNNVGPHFKIYKISFVNIFIVLVQTQQILVTTLQQVTNNKLLQ